MTEALAGETRIMKMRVSFMSYNLRMWLAFLHFDDRPMG